MKLFIQLAIRNVHRNIRSALLNGIGIFLSVILLLFAFALSRGIEKQIVQQNIRFETGAVSMDFKKEIANQKNALLGDSIYKTVMQVLNGSETIKGFRTRIYPNHSILYTDANENERVKLRGITPEETDLLSSLHMITEGAFDTADYSKSMMISDGLAESLNLRIGDICRILQQTIDGMVNLEEYEITAIFQYTSQANKDIVYMDYTEARQLYNCNLPTKLLIDLDDTGKAGDVKDYLISALGQDVFFSISAYTDHIDTARAIASINKYSFIGIATFLILISFVGFWSMQSENVNERKKEIGTLLSFGFKEKSVKKIFLLESVYISLICITVGSLLIILSIGIINLCDGLFLGESASFAFGSVIINPQMSLTDFFFTSATAILYPLIATYFSLRIMNKCNITSFLKPLY